MAMPDIPMYVFTGFLESGKTKFIQETLEDERFNTGERTLLLVFEEGEEEYDVSTYPHKEVYEQVLDYEDLSPELLTGLQKKYRAERVVVELNGMHLAADFYLKTPDHWKIAQEVMFADATTFLSYNANMRWPRHPGQAARRGAYRRHSRPECGLCRPAGLCPSGCRTRRSRCRPL